MLRKDLIEISAQICAAPSAIFKKFSGVVKKYMDVCSKNFVSSWRLRTL